MTPIIFRGNGTEYFKIWIVNILLTIITLGLYHPWAKVRTHRYFYGNTEFDNANFDYHATGKQLFLSYLIAMILLALYVVLGQVNPTASIALPIVLFFAIPWIIWRGIRFNLRMSSYRNVRFDFNGTLSGSYATFLVFPIGLLLILSLSVGLPLMVLVDSTGSARAIAVLISILMLLLAYPTFIAMINKVTTTYINNGVQFGQGQFSADLKFKSFFMIIIKGIFLGFLLTTASTLLLGLLFSSVLELDQLSGISAELSDMRNGDELNPLVIIILSVFYAVMLIVGLFITAYLKALHRTYIFKQTFLDNSISFESTLSAGKYFGILITNLLLIIFTLGLAYPWTAVRKYRYLTESTNIDAPDGFDGYMSKHKRDGALGEELTDAFDIDVGGIAF